MDESKNTMPTRDNVAGDLLQIISDSQMIGYSFTPHEPGHKVLDTDLLMQKLCSFVSRRDSTIFNHAYNLGKEDLKREVRGRLEKGFPKNDFKQEYPNNAKEK